MFLCSASFDSTVKLWDVELGKLLYSLNGHRYWPLLLSLMLFEGDYNRWGAFQFHWCLIFKLQGSCIFLLHLAQMVSIWPVDLLINPCTSGHWRKTRLSKLIQAMGAYLKFAGTRKLTRLPHVLPTVQFVFWVSECKVLENALQFPWFSKALWPQEW